MNTCEPLATFILILNIRTNRSVQTVQTHIPSASFGRIIALDTHNHQEPDQNCQKTVLCLLRALQYGEGHIQMLGLEMSKAHLCHVKLKFS